MVEQAGNSRKVAAPSVRPHSVNLAHTVRPDIAVKAQGPLRPLNIGPNSLPGLMAGLAPGLAGECPYCITLRLYVAQKGLFNADSTLFARFLFRHGDASLQLICPQSANIANA